MSGSESALVCNVTWGFQEVLEARGREISFTSIRTVFIFCVCISLVALMFFVARRHSLPISKGLPMLTIFTALGFLLQSLFFGIITDPAVWQSPSAVQSSLAQSCDAYFVGYIFVYNNFFMLFLRSVALRVFYTNASSDSNAVFAQLLRTSAKSGTDLSSGDNTSVASSKFRMLSTIVHSRVLVGVFIFVAIILHVAIISLPLFFSDCPCALSIDLYMSIAVFLLYVLLGWYLSRNLKAFDDSLYINKGSRNIFIIAGIGLLAYIGAKLHDVIIFGTDFRKNDLLQTPDQGVTFSPQGIIVSNIILIFVPFAVLYFLVVVPGLLTFKFKTIKREPNLQRIEPEEPELDEARALELNNGMNSDFLLLIGRPLPPHLSTRNVGSAAQVHHEEPPNSPIARMDIWFDGPSNSNSPEATSPESKMVSPVSSFVAPELMNGANGNRMINASEVLNSGKDQDPETVRNSMSDKESNDVKTRRLEKLLSKDTVEEDKKRATIKEDKLNDWFNLKKSGTRADYNTVARGFRQTPQWTMQRPSVEEQPHEEELDIDDLVSSMRAPEAIQSSAHPKGNWSGLMWNIILCNIDLRGSSRLRKLDELALDLVSMEKIEKVPFVVVINSRVGLKKFKQFCLKELSYENPLFYESVTAFVKTFEDPLVMTSEEVQKFRQRAWKIYDLYLRENAKLWVNLPFTVSQKLSRAGFKEGYTFDVFLVQEAMLDALNNIYTLMKTDTFERFRLSDLFLEFGSEYLQEKARTALSTSMHLPRPFNLKESL